MTNAQVAVLFKAGLGHWKTHVSQFRRYYFFVSILALLYAVGQLFFPLEIVEATTRFKLRMWGVEQVEREGVQGLLKDHCYGIHTVASSPAPQCACVAMIHGLGDNALTWKTLLLWPDEMWTRMGLIKPLKLFAMDLPGSGKSPPPSDVTDYRARNQARKLHTVLSSLCSHWVVVGNSFGGWVASWLALDWSEGVDRLILLDSAGLKSEKSENASLLAQPTIESLKEFQRKAYFKPREIPDRIWKVIVQRAQLSNSRQVVAAQTNEDYLDLALPTLRKPTLLMWGEEDRILPITQGQEMRSLIPAVMWRDVPRCGHLLQKECPAVVVQAIVDMTNFGRF